MYLWPRRACRPFSAPPRAARPGLSRAVSAPTSAGPAVRPKGGPRTAVVWPPEISGRSEGCEGPFGPSSRSECFPSPWPVRLMSPGIMPSFAGSRETSAAEDRLLQRPTFRLPRILRKSHSASYFALTALEIHCFWQQRCGVSARDRNGGDLATCSRGLFKMMKHALLLTTALVVSSSVAVAAGHQAPKLDLNKIH